jgi:hypothetical protein
MPPATQTHDRWAFLTTMGQIAQRNLHPFRADIAMDIGSTRPGWMVDKCPCLTARRAATGGHWISSRGRRTYLGEMLRLQGFKPALVQTGEMSAPAMGRLVGNAMSVNVLERLLLRLLPAVGLAQPERLRARWESAQMAKLAIREHF